VQNKLLVCLFALRACVGEQPQRDVGWLHRLPYHSHQIVAEGLQVCFMAQLSREGFQGLSGIVLPTIEATIHYRLYSAPEGG
jgi:hypothetical protein